MEIIAIIGTKKKIKNKGNDSKRYPDKISLQDEYLR